MSGRLEMAVTDLGPTQLKNIDKSIRAYSVEVGKQAQAKPITKARKTPLVSRPAGRGKYASLGPNFQMITAAFSGGCWPRPHL